jgi:hypothetical protein
MKTDPNQQSPGRRIFEQLSGSAGFSPDGVMNDPALQQLLETSWRRELTPEEQARLRALLETCPEVDGAWQAEASLTRLLRRLPSPAPSSNFTRQVLSALETSEDATGLSLALRWWHRWTAAPWARIAWAAAALLLVLAAFQQYHVSSRNRLVHTLARLPEVATLPSPESLLDFDAIQQLGRVPPSPVAGAAVSDDDILKALQ